MAKTSISKTSHLATLCKFIHKKIQLRYDFFMVITGDEGLGKSRGILLNIIDYWYKGLLGKRKIPLGALNVDIKDFVKSLKKGVVADLRSLDEAGDSMDTQEYANKINRLLYQAYTVIRERKYFSIVVLPSFFDLNPRFRKRRVRLLINVTKRIDNKCKKCSNIFAGDSCNKCKSTNFKKGFIRYDVYTRKQLREILERNRYRHIKSLRVGITPVASGTVGEYKGELTEYYDKLKTDKTKEVLYNLEKDITEFSNQKVCGHQWNFTKKNNNWWCRLCGKITRENPYTEIKE